MAESDRQAQMEELSRALRETTQDGRLNVFGERMDEEGPCHCGEPGERYSSKSGFWCGECAFAVHDTCECSDRSGAAQ